jgi:putative transposase
MTRKPYPSDVSDAQWNVIEALIPPAKSNFKIGGRARTVNMREVINGLFYIARTGCSWLQLPHDLPPSSTVKEYFYQFRDDGTWECINAALREQVRVKEGREKTPSAAIIDSQSVKTTEKGGLAVMTQARRSRAASGISW